MINKLSSSPSINEAEFMQYMEVENHDDFYSFNGEGKVRVWDQRGMAVVYEAALEDLQKLESELLTVGSYFIQQERGDVKKEVCLLSSFSCRSPLTQGLHTL